jgi:predicted enzyme related to lactoylglutathione lyase
MANALNWFEIPVSDTERAVRFYSSILGVELKATSYGDGYQMAQFPSEGGVGGALICGPDYAPGTTGTLVYLSCGPDLGVVLDRVQGAGGKVVLPKMSIGEHGYAAMFIDSEGNRVGLHSMG